MTPKQIAFSVLLAVTVLSAACFARQTTVIIKPDMQLTMSQGPEPVPICPPEQGSCDTVPFPQTGWTIAMGPEPVPICPPEQGSCDTVPLPQTGWTIAMGPEPVPICPPEQGSCDTVPMPKTGLADFLL